VAAQLNELNDIEDLARALDESDRRPVLIFKRSNSCPISTKAYSQFLSFLEQADSNVSYNLVTVQEARDVSNEIASRLRLEHQSPQAILIRKGRTVWNASHFAITVESLSDAVAAV